MFQPRLDLLQNQFSSNPELIGKLVAMPDAPIYLAAWEGNGVCAAAKAKCDEVKTSQFITWRLKGLKVDE